MRKNSLTIKEKDKFEYIKINFHSQKTPQKDICNVHNQQIIQNLKKKKPKKHPQINEINNPHSLGTEASIGAHDSRW